MRVPGLTCAACRDPYAAGELARRTPDGYVHAVPCSSPAELTGGRWAPTGAGTLAWAVAS